MDLHVICTLLQLTLHSHLKEQEKAGLLFTLVDNALIGALKICGYPAVVVRQRLYQPMKPTPEAKRI